MATWTLTSSCNARIRHPGISSLLKTVLFRAYHKLRLLYLPLREHSRYKRGCREVEVTNMSVEVHVLHPLKEETSMIVPCVHAFTPFLTPSHLHLRPRRTWPKSSPTSFGGRLEHGLLLWSTCALRARSSSSSSEGKWSQLPRKEQERDMTFSSLFLSSLPPLPPLPPSPAGMKTQR